MSIPWWRKSSMPDLTNLKDTILSFSRKFARKSTEAIYHYSLLPGDVVTITVSGQAAVDIDENNKIVITCVDDASS